MNIREMAGGYMISHDNQDFYIEENAVEDFKEQVEEEVFEE